MLKRRALDLIQITEKFCEFFWFDVVINFRYNVTELVENGKIVATLENGQKIESEPSVLKLNCEC